jgi:hypothetical protein
LTLRTLYRLPSATGAVLLGIDAGRFERLHTEGLRSLHETLLSYARRDIEAVTRADQQASRTTTE